MHLRRCREPGWKVPEYYAPSRVFLCYRSENRTMIYYARGLSTPPRVKVIPGHCRKHASLNIERTWLDIAGVFYTRLDIPMMQGRKINDFWARGFPTPPLVQGIACQCKNIALYKNEGTGNSETPLKRNRIPGQSCC